MCILHTACTFMHAICTLSTRRLIGYFQLFVKQKTCADFSAQVFTILNFLLILLQEFVQLLEISQNFIVEIQLWDINRAAIILTDAIGQAANFNSVIFRKTTAIFKEICILYHQ